MRIQKRFRGKSALQWLSRSTLDGTYTRWVTIPGYGNCELRAVRNDTNQWCAEALCIMSIVGRVCLLEVGPRATSVLNLDLIHEYKDARKRLGHSC